MWRETTKHPRNLKIWQEELEDFMPPSVLDFHVHLLNTGVTKPEETFSCAGHDMTKYDLDDLRQDLPEMYPGRRTLAVCFGFPTVGYNQAVNDEYVAKACDGKRFFAFRLLDPHESPEAVRRSLASGRFWGIKPYLDYVRKNDLNQVEVREMLPDAIMEIVNDLGLIVMLHVPRKARLADPLNQQQVIDLCNKYPRAKIVLAHIGRAYYLRNIVGQLDRLKDPPNLYFDLAMLNNWEVLEYLFANVEGGKILYGTDIPLALAPGKSVEINHQYTYVTPVPWKLSISDDHGKLVFTSFVYEELRAIRRAVERLSLGRAFVEGLFHDNGMKLLKAVRA